MVGEGNPDTDKLKELSVKKDDNPTHPEEVDSKIQAARERYLARKAKK